MPFVDSHMPRAFSNVTEKNNNNCLALLCDLREGMGGLYNLIIFDIGLMRLYVLRDSQGSFQGCLIGRLVNRTHSNINRSIGFNNQHQSNHNILFDY